MYKVYKYQNISTTAVVNCCTVCGTVFVIEYNIVIGCISKHSYYCCTDCVDLFSPSQLLSVHVCLELGTKHFTGMIMEKESIYITDGIENASLSLHYIGI